MAKNLPPCLKNRTMNLTIRFVYNAVNCRLFLKKYFVTNYITPDTYQRKDIPKKLHIKSCNGSPPTNDQKNFTQSISCQCCQLFGY